MAREKDKQAAAFSAHLTLNWPFLIYCRCATTTRTVTARLTGRLRSATRQVSGGAWTAAPSDWQVSQQSQLEVHEMADLSSPGVVLC